MSSYYAKSKGKSFGGKRSRTPKTLKKMTLKLVMSGADAYTEQKVDTNANENTRQCMLVHKVLAHIPYDADDAHWFQIQVAMASSTASLALDDSDLVTQVLYQRPGAIAAGVYVHKMPINILEGSGPLLLGSRQFYINFDANTGDAETLYVDVWYEDITVSAKGFNSSW